MDPKELKERYAFRKEKYKLWKESQKERIKDTKNVKRMKRGQAKWKKQALTWKHKHPKR